MAEAVRRLEGDYVLTMDDEARLLPSAAVDIGSDGRIAAVGAIADLGPAPSDVDRVGGLLMPGLVNAHAHTPMTLVRSVGDGLPLADWLRDGVWPREGRMTAEDAWWGMVGGSVEMLESGVTTSCEMYLFEDQVADAVERTGGRAVVTPGVISALSPDGRVDGRLAEIVAFHRARHDPEGRITVGFAPHSVYDLTPEQCGEIAAEAASVDALFHIHLEETRAERELVIERYGRPATQLLAEVGAFAGKAMAAHGVWLDADDRRILAEAGVAVAHCPLSNLKLGSGIAPVREMLADGIVVGVGTDGPASNDNLDLWEELKMAPLLARGRSLDPRAMTARTALTLATSASAMAIGLSDVGHLSVGAHADLIRVDLDQPAFEPGEDLLTHLVFAGSSRYVTDVWVAGKRVVRGGRVQTVDRDKVLAEMAARGRRLGAGV
ncbi:MAG: amidohydrolase [Acidimicrobiia bacterium]|nr:amidohydrolase [Acidimicrobiia bacterium]